MATATGASTPAPYAVQAVQAEQQSGGVLARLCLLRDHSRGRRPLITCRADSSRRRTAFPTHAGVLWTRAAVMPASDASQGATVLAPGTVAAAATALTSPEREGGPAVPVARGGRRSQEHRVLTPPVSSPRR